MFYKRTEPSIPAQTRAHFRGARWHRRRRIEFAAVVEIRNSLPRAPPLLPEARPRHSGEGSSERRGPRGEEKIRGLAKPSLSRWLPSSLGLHPCVDRAGAEVPYTGGPLASRSRRALAGG